MADSLEHVYTTHHANRRGDGFVLLGDERGAFLQEAIGIGKTVLDIGCRDGSLTRWFSEGNQVTGADIDMHALALAKENLGIDVRQVDLNGDWEVPLHSYDAVVAAEVLEHLYYPSVVIAKAAAVLKKDGVFAGTIPSAFSLRHRIRYLFKQKHNTPLGDPTHINHFTVKELETLLKTHFEQVEVIGYGRLGWLARTFPQTFAYGLMWRSSSPKQI